MADTAISALSAAAGAIGTMELPVNDGGTNAKLTVDQIESYVENLAGIKFLGAATLGGAAARTGDVIWTGDYGCLICKYDVTGYAGNAIARLILGSGSISETGTDCSCELIAGVTRTTTAVSICGWPVAVTLDTNPRYGIFVVGNISGSVIRRAFGIGMWGGSAGAVPTGMKMGAHKNAIAQLDRARLTSFNAITGNTVGSNMNTGTNLKVWGLKG